MAKADNLIKVGANIVSRLDKTNKILSLVFHVIWIVVGLFVLLVVVQGFRQGVYSNLLSFKSQKATSDVPQTGQQPPLDVDVEGVGKVNVSCAKDALSDASIQKLIESKDINSLTPEERSKFQACIVEATPSASPK